MDCKRMMFDRKHKKEFDHIGFKSMNWGDTISHATDIEESDHNDSRGDGDSMDIDLNLRNEGGLNGDSHVWDSGDVVVMNWGPLEEKVIGG